MLFTEVPIAQSAVAAEILQAYTESFPEDERRSEAQFYRLFSNPDCRILSITDQEERIGYLILWPLEHFVFLEHFEVYASQRNKKLGSKILEELQQKCPKIILESEPDTESEWAARRLKFYERNGFSVIMQHYIQPSYGINKKPVPLFLLANFPTDESEKFSQEIHTKVYGV